MRALCLKLWHLKYIGTWLTGLMEKGVWSSVVFSTNSRKFLIFLTSVWRKMSVRVKIQKMWSSVREQIQPRNDTYCWFLLTSCSQSTWIWMIYHRFLTAALTRMTLVISCTMYLEYCVWFLSYYSMSTLNLKGLSTAVKILPWRLRLCDLPLQLAVWSLTGHPIYMQ